MARRTEKKDLQKSIANTEGTEQRNLNIEQGKTRRLGGVERQNETQNQDGGKKRVSKNPEELSATI